ncbi:MAG: hypothetical protein AAGE96_23835 [Cyanobacteria bacterium P01_G01_bin.19]
MDERQWVGIDVCQKHLDVSFMPFRVQDKGFSRMYAHQAASFEMIICGYFVFIG